MFVVCTHCRYLLFIPSGSTVWCNKVQHVVLLWSFREINVDTTHSCSFLCLCCRKLSQHQNEIQNDTIMMTLKYKTDHDQSSISGAFIAFQ